MQTLLITIVVFDMVLENPILHSPGSQEPGPVIVQLRQLLAQLWQTPLISVVNPILQFRQKLFVKQVTQLESMQLSQVPPERTKYWG